MNNFIQTPFEITDAYKLSHWRQYPEGTTGVYSNFTPRKSRRPGIDKFVFFGLQAFLQELNEQFDVNFFALTTGEAVQRFDTFYAGFFGVENPHSNEQVSNLHKLGYLPIKIKALREGSVVNHNVPVATMQSTHEDFFWFTQWIETWMSDSIWKPSTSATTAYYYRKIFDRFNAMTCENNGFVDWQGHDFSMRGMSNVLDACASGAGHLLSFKGTDTCPALSWIKAYYPGNNGLIGSSVSATEHSVQTAFLPEITNDTDLCDEQYTAHTLELYPDGIVSQVCDGYDFWRFITVILPKFKDQIMSRDGKFVIRPDSSPKTPVEVIIGDPEAPEGTPEHKGLISCLYEIFGGTKNSKGYITLDSHIGAIYGDSITLEYAEAILSGLEKKGFSSDNIVLGIGSYTYQYVTRDTHGIAIKATAVASGRGKDQKWRATYKDPKTDNSGKKSAKGFLRMDKIDGEYVLSQNLTQDEAEGGALELVYENGTILRTQSFADIRQTLSEYQN
jgi:nicotinamide phosphoribosyltransferase